MEVFLRVCFPTLPPTPQHARPLCTGLVSRLSALSLSSSRGTCICSVCESQSGHQMPTPLSSSASGQNTRFRLLQLYSLLGLVAQMVKKLQETQVRSLGQEDPLEDMATHSSILSCRIPKDRGAWRATVHEVTESDRTEQLTLPVTLFTLCLR